MSMTWNQALSGVAVVSASTSEAPVTGVQYDSRRVGPSDLFVAMRGGVADGNRFVDKALNQGAAGIITDSAETYEKLANQVPTALVQHGRRALAEVSANVFHHPERSLAVCAITGTNGKTTTAYLLEQILKSANRTCVLLGTIETHIGNEVRPSEHTTPEARDLYALFADGVAAGATECVMEMSSHALEQERVWGVPVDVAIFTNLTQDHLDYHETMEAYFEAKARLFQGVGAPAPAFAIINHDDPYGHTLLERAFRYCGSVLTYSAANESADYIARNVELAAGKTTFSLQSPQGQAIVTTQLTGRVNVYNLLAAMAAAMARGVTLDEAVRSAAQLEPANS